MNCHQVRGYLDPFLDGETEVQKNMEVLAHLNLCRECSRIYEGERALRGLLKERLAEEAPKSLAAKLFPRFEVSPPRWRPRMITGLAASLFMGLAAMLLFSAPTPVRAAALAESATRTHEATRETPPGTSICVRSCCCATDKSAMLTAFYAKQLPYVPCLHDLRGLGYEETYGAIWEVVPGKRVCWINYRQAATGRFISHASVHGIEVSLSGGEEVLKMGMTIHLFRISGKVAMIAGMPDGIT